MTERVWNGYGGWVLYRSTDLPCPVFIRFADVEARLVPVDLFIENDDGIDVNLLRRIPLGRLESWANTGKTAKAIRDDLAAQPGPDLRTAVRFFRHGLGPAYEPTASPNEWPLLMLLAQYDDVDGPVMELPRLATVTRDHSAALPTPKSRPYPDSFYRHVAEVYGRLIEVGKKPAPAISEANNVPITTAHRWVREARRRGFLPPARAGRAG
jgi:hypothetical protein